MTPFSGPETPLFQRSERMACPLLNTQLLSNSFEPWGPLCWESCSEQRGPKPGKSVGKRTKINWYKGIWRDTSSFGSQPSRCVCPMEMSRLSRGPSVQSMWSYTQKSGPKKQPKHKVFGRDIPGTSGTQTSGYPGQKLYASGLFLLFWTRSGRDVLGFGSGRPGFGKTLCKKTLGWF